MKKSLSRIAALILVLVLLSSAGSALAGSYAQIVYKAMPVYSDKNLTHRIGTVPKWTIAVVKDGYYGSDFMTYKLNVNGKTCYAKSGYMTSGDQINVFLPKGQNEFPTIRTVSNCKVYAYPSTGSKSVPVKKGVKLMKIAEAKGWVLCGYGTYLGYIQKKNLS